VVGRAVRVVAPPPTLPRSACAVAVTPLPPFLNFGTEDELADLRRQAALFI
jgi:hypothetical protein